MLQFIQKSRLPHSHGGRVKGVNMFLARSGLKRLMRNAYKGGGLRVRRDHAGLHISGAYWTVYFIWGEWPKETMGDLISLVGVLPDVGEQYLATKDGNQMEIWDDSIQNAMEISAEGKQYLELSPVILNEGTRYYRMMRDPETKEIICINEVYYSYVNPELVDADDDEMLPEGPIIGYGSLLGKVVHVISWHNNRMAFAVMPERPQNERIIKICNDFEIALTKKDFENAENKERQEA